MDGNFTELTGLHCLYDAYTLSMVSNLASAQLAPFLGDQTAQCKEGKRLDFPKRCSIWSLASSSPLSIPDLDSASGGLCIPGVAVVQPPGSHAAAEGQMQ